MKTMIRHVLSIAALTVVCTAAIAEGGPSPNEADPTIDSVAADSGSMSPTGTASARSLEPSTLIPLSTELPVLAPPNGPVDTAIATRIAAARVRLDALMSAREGASTRVADAATVAAAEAAEHALAQTQRKAGELSWRLQQMRLYQDEIQAQGIRLPAKTVLYEVDQQRDFHERDSYPVTSIEISMQLAYTTQSKTTYASLDSVEPAPGGDLEAGQTFLWIGLLRSPKARRVLAWVLGRGQLILAHSDIALISGD